jgi:hypothetical protein
MVHAIYRPAEVIMESDQKRWCLDRKINVTNIVAFAGLIVSLIFWGTDVDQRIELLSQQQSFDRSRAEAERLEHQAELREINDNLKSLYQILINRQNP